MKPIHLNFLLSYFFVFYVSLRNFFAWVRDQHLMHPTETVVASFWCVYYLKLTWTEIPIPISTLECRSSFFMRVCKHERTAFHTRHRRNHTDEGKSHLYHGYLKRYVSSHFMMINSDIIGKSFSEIKSPKLSHRLMNSVFRINAKGYRSLNTSGLQRYLGIAFLCPREQSTVASP